MTHASVFSGIGGPEVAAAMLGWENLFTCEINPFCRAVLEYWFPNATSYEDITTTDFSEWRGKVNVLTGGFPCQPFSKAGKRRGANDDRYLWPHMFRCIDQVRPDWVVCENVTGVLSMVEQGEVTEMATEMCVFDQGDTFHRFKFIETYTIERIFDDLESHGYAVQTMVIPACAVGACHKRNRVFVIGWRNGGLCEGSHQNSMRVGLHESEKLGNIKRQGNTGADGRIGHIAENTRFRTEWTGKGWRPAVSPVHGGNDGLPFPLADLTISPSKWRTESLKAYGNAIVPQVMYEIFRVIEATY